MTGEKVDTQSVPHPILLVNGPPASGKTALAHQLHARLGWAVFSKDALKESLFDVWERQGRVTVDGPGCWKFTNPTALGCDPADWLDDHVTTQLVSLASEHRPCIVDTNVAERQTALFSRLAPNLTEILLTADAQELVRRYNTRTGRHTVHKPQATTNGAQWGGTPNITIPSATRIVVDTQDLQPHEVFHAVWKVLPHMNGGNDCRSQSEGLKNEE